MEDTAFWWRGMVAANTAANTIALRMLLKKGIVSTEEFDALMEETIGNLKQRWKKNAEIPDNFYASLLAHLETIVASAKA